LLALARKSLRDWHWLVFFGAVLAAWAGLYAMQLPAELLAGAELYGAEFWAALCRVEPGWAGYPAAFLMWALMAGAMMAPTFVPALAVFDDFIAGRAARRADFALLLGGYIGIWLGFAALAALAQVWLAQFAMLSPAGQSLSPWLTAALLLTAGAYQFSALKHACLTQCMAPFMFFMTHWHDTRWNAARLGLRLGALCLGCCWALMLLGFVGGTMNLAWMGAATVLMVLEKLPQAGRFVTRPLGGALIIAGLAVAAGTVI
jgi:predicted metal-binding membrane protein